MTAIVCRQESTGPLGMTERPRGIWLSGHDRGQDATLTAAAHLAALPALISVGFFGWPEVQNEQDGVDEEIGEGPAEDKQGPQGHIAHQADPDAQRDGEE